MLQNLLIIKMLDHCFFALLFRPSGLSCFLHFVNTQKRFQPVIQQMCYWLFCIGILLHVVLAGVFVLLSACASYFKLACKLQSWQTEIDVCHMPGQYKPLDWCTIVENRLVVSYCSVRWHIEYYIFDQIRDLVILTK